MFQRWRDSKRVSRELSDSKSHLSQRADGSRDKGTKKIPAMVVKGTVDTGDQRRGKNANVYISDQGNGRSVVVRVADPGKGESTVMYAGSKSDTNRHYRSTSPMRKVKLGCLSLILATIGCAAYNFYLTKTHPPTIGDYCAPFKGHDLLASTTFNDVANQLNAQGSTDLVQRMLNVFNEHYETLDVSRSFANVAQDLMYHNDLCGPLDQPYKGSSSLDSTLSNLGGHGGLGSHYNIGDSVHHFLNNMSSMSYSLDDIASGLMSVFALATIVVSAERAGKYAYNVVTDCGRIPLKDAIVTYTKDMAAQSKAGIQKVVNAVQAYTPRKLAMNQKLAY